MDPIRETDLTDLIMLLNCGESIEQELACEYIFIRDNDFPPYMASGGRIYLDGKAKSDFDILCEAGAIAGIDVGKPYLVGLCIWNNEIHGEQPEEGKLLAKKFGIGKEFIETPVE